MIGFVVPSVLQNLNSERGREKWLVSSSVTRGPKKDIRTPGEDEAAMVRKALV
jgi:hypothetical protein